MTATIHKFPIEKARRTYRQELEAITQFYTDLAANKGNIGWSHKCGDFGNFMVMTVKGERCDFCHKTEDEIRNDTQT